MRSLACIFALFACGLVGCGPSIGDSCTNSLDCSSRNNRICDREQPGGYCTIAGCEETSCPDDAICVTFLPYPERLARNWCMAECEDDSDCRDGEGYRCRSAAQLNRVVAHSAAVPYKPRAKFCVVPPITPTPEQMMSMPDASTDDAGTDDASTTDAGASDAAM